MNHAFLPRSVSVAIAFVVAVAASPSQVERLDITHEYVGTIAQELASRPYEDTVRKLPKFLETMTYDDYRRIRFIEEEALWNTDDTRFKVHFFHPGAIHHDSVKIHEFTEGYSQRIPFVRSFFDYQDLRVPWRLSGKLDYAGFKLLYPVNSPDKVDELVSFLGASYFRALGQGHRYGLSARGLSINSGGPPQEEFPSFREFWIGKPVAGDKSITVHALLNSHSVAGAYTFTITPGIDTSTDVRATLFFRNQPEILGYATMTSMFWYGENSSTQHGDFRPEVHDSDGLLVATDATSRIWRPLENPKHVRRTDIEARDLVGFGLIQRDRDFESYQDTEAFYHDRPTLWMEPVGNWPDGVVRLVELPTGDEYQDNIVAFWMPSHPPPIGQPVEIEWRLGWTSSGRMGGPDGTVVATRRSTREAHLGKSKYVVDFSLKEFGDIPDNARISAVVSAQEPAVVEYHSVEELPGGERWRLIMHLKTSDASETSEVKARLLLGGAPITETVLLTWTP